MFLGKTIEDILSSIEGNTEVIVILDGYKPDPPLKSDPRVTLIYHTESIGQRAATNEAAKLSKAKYLMKCDAHCAFDKGFDVKMIQEMHDDWTMVPIMRNLHAFDWVCPDGHRRYQGPSGPCLECKKPTERDVVWIAKTNPSSKSYCFDSTPHFQYFGEYIKRPEAQAEITETMSLQGSCWMLTRDKYWELNICDEKFGSWGSQGIEVAVKTWLSGGRVAVNHKTWYAHMFRTQGGDFGFPYPISGAQQKHAQNYARDLFFNNNWPQQTRPLSWLVEKFWPVKGWTEEDLKKLKANKFMFSTRKLKLGPGESEPTEDPTKGIIYYSDCGLDEKIAKPVRDQILSISQEKNIPIVSATLKRMDFGTKNIHFPSLKRGYLAMFKQIMAALEHSTADIIFFCEHDVLYHPAHFDFTPPDKETFYYNQNVWFLRLKDGHAMHYNVNQLSGLCGYKEALYTHFKERFELIEKEGFSRRMGFEPMTHNRIKWQNMFKLGTWKSRYPNIDIRHSGNSTGQRWKKSQFRNKKLLIGWKESDTKIHGWGKTIDLIKKL
ncbi:MAG: hypothetical protein UV74_C0002G0035 [Candidatus Woesebacteria bacterium GW2011_GWB1_43_14]|uniref:Glycosyltransferase 2-like domain-containing protein n=1 Tax=Candidatus Woesebacteria bacterium GW2011_GWB1_43_14 TaxID=1618578 RepID=A0A0G1FUZ2_9BACT|nr:MAG: hypothetical protein UV51_C0004G0082 [Candidatus Woesebacteria bacterium GW2011_GWC1_42_9]KKS98816.1 MAG: hypothetical protein UV74_C0002G0035 [Candidatus Woesebacteria bacterium GW2011_GWB1_43_14]